MGVGGGRRGRAPHTQVLLFEPPGFVVSPVRSPPPPLFPPSRPSLHCYSFARPSPCASRHSSPARALSQPFATGASLVRPRTTVRSLATAWPASRRSRCPLGRGDSEPEEIAGGWAPAGLGGRDPRRASWRPHGVSVSEPASAILRSPGRSCSCSS